MVQSINLSSIRYCPILLSYASKLHIKRLEIVQNKIIRTIYNLDGRTNVNNIKKQIGWLNIKNFIKFYIVCFIHKIKMKLTTPKLRKLLKLRTINNYKLRNSNQFNVSKIVSEKDRKIWIK